MDPAIAESFLSTDAITWTLKLRPNVKFSDGTSFDAAAVQTHWTRLTDRIRSTERTSGDVPVAIYGSGFYGAYIASTLQHPNRLHCFLDRSPYQQGKSLFGKPIVAPEQLPSDIRVLYVGLNPAIARATVAKMEWLRERGLHLIYLDESER